MATEPIYIPRSPGDLIAADDWNNLQSRIKDDIGKQIKEAIKNLTTVPNSENTHKIDNQTSDDLTKAILEKAFAQLPLRVGYLRKFKMLSNKTETVIEHKLGAYPEVDIYELVKFDAICSEDDIKTKTNVLFYLYQEEETKITTLVRDATSAEKRESVVIEAKDETPFRVSFEEMLSYYGVKDYDDFTLDSVETAFWTAFITQNDKFDDDLRCHSPWFDRCCGEKRTVTELKRIGAWKKLWFKVVPHKMINVLFSADTTAPRQVEVRQFDFNTIGVKLLDSPVTTLVERGALIIMKV
ncbi:MAG TPA: hypothetical protein VN687_10165 [Blastocatellia bacterium]|nr:hypothetical protein [Blastocatellia bacterium]